MLPLPQTFGNPFKARCCKYLQREPVLLLSILQYHHVKEPAGSSRLGQVSCQFLCWIECAKMVSIRIIGLYLMHTGLWELCRWHIMRSPGPLCYRSYTASVHLYYSSKKQFWIQPSTKHYKISSNSKTFSKSAQLWLVSKIWPFGDVLARTACFPRHTLMESINDLSSCITESL